MRGEKNNNEGANMKIYIVMRDAHGELVSAAQLAAYGFRVSEACLPRSERKMTSPETATVRNTEQKSGMNAVHQGRGNCSGVDSTCPNA